MKDIFAPHNKRKKLKDTLFFYAFYTVLLYLFALSLVFIGKDNEICLFNFHCVSSKAHWLQASLILYFYFLIMVVVLIQTYKQLEKLVAHKNHLRYFKYIFYAMPFFVTAVVLLAGTNSDDAWLIIIFSAILSLAGLLMIEFRKTKDK